MFRKGLAVAVILLFIGMTISSSASFNLEKQSTIATFEGTTFYVDDDFNESTPGWNVTHFATINRARDNAVDGDTIFVYSGTYGRFHVRKSIQIIGENKHTTIINGNWSYFNTISIETENFLIKGFTVIKGGYGISVQNQRDVIISDMILTNNDLGIIHRNNRNVHIDNITFDHNNGKAFEFWNAQNCSITHCIFDNDGIYHGGFSPSGSNSLYFRYNLFTNNSPLSLGYQCTDNGKTVIESNVFQNNDYAIITNTCTDVITQKNNFIDNGQHIRLRKITPFIMIPLYINFKNNWDNNYWDDWSQIDSYKIKGFWHHHVLPFIKFPIREFDYNPAQEPFDI